MGAIHKVIAPLSVSLSRNKHFILNLNKYRNSHYHLLNKAKHLYEEVISAQVDQLPKFKCIALTLTLYPANKRMTDLDNVLSVHTKFFQDALVNFNKIYDDDYTFIKEVHYLFGEIDRDNPRIEILIEEIECK